VLIAEEFINSQSASWMREFRELNKVQRTASTFKSFFQGIIFMFLSKTIIKDRQEMEKYVGSWSQHYGCGQSWTETALELRSDGSCDVRQEWGGEKCREEGSRSGKGTWKLSADHIKIEVSYLVDDGEDKGSEQKITAQIEDFSEDAYFRKRWNKRK